MLLHQIVCGLRARLVPRAALLATLIAILSIGFAQRAGADDPTTPSADQGQPVTEPTNPAFLEEPSFVSRGFDLAKELFGADEGERKSGFYPEFSNMITGSGFVSAGPGYRAYFNNGKAFFDTSAALSWHLYKMVQGRLEFSELANDHLTLGTQAMWQDNTQVSYYGLGPGAVGDNQTQYRLQTADFVGYAAVRPAPWLSFGGEVGWLKRPRVMATAGTFNPDYPDARAVYAHDPGMSGAYQPNYLHSELSVTANTLDSRSHPTEGTLARGALTSYSDQSAGTFTFNQYEAEIVHMVPLGDKRVVLGFHGWTLFSDVASNHAVPFYLMPVLGGNNTLRAFDDYQFHDLNTVLATAELRVRLLAHLDAAGFFDAGNVAARYGDLNFDKTSVGGGLRLHMDRATFARMDVAHGSEGWKFILRTSDPFKYSRVKRMLAIVPFMP